MIFTVKALIRGTPKDREVTTNIAGCVDAEDAKQKFKQYYPVLAFRWVKPVEEKKK